MVQSITNYIQITEDLYTSGQPTEEQFKLIREQGVDMVMNLAMPDSDSAIANEGYLVTSLGMNYVHIPVVWEAPKMKQFILFRDVLRLHRYSKVWVHCALNWRVSSFIYLYKVIELNVSQNQAYSELLRVWQPNAHWLAFFERVQAQS